MQGIIGQFLSVIPIVVVIMLLCSLFEAIFILPIHARSLLKPIKSRNVFTKLNNLYKKYLLWSIKHFNYIVILFIIYFVATIIIAKSHLSFVLFPSSGIQEAKITLELEENAVLSITENITKELSKDIISAVGDDIVGISSTVGQAVVDFVANSKKKGNNYGYLEVKFTAESSFADREQDVVKNIRDIVDDYRKKYQLVDGSVEILRDGPPVGREINFCL